MNRKKRRANKQRLEAEVDRASRSCGECAACCTHLAIHRTERFSKPAGEPCPHELTTKGCSIYPYRPDVCRDFMCEWKTRYLDEALRPDKSGFMVYPRSSAGLNWLVAKDIVPGACEVHMEALMAASMALDKPLLVEAAGILVGPEDKVPLLQELLRRVLQVVS